MPGQVACFSLNVLNPSMHAEILPHRSAQPRAVGLQAKLSSTCGQGVLGSMPAGPGIQSVIRRLAVTKN